MNKEEISRAIVNITGMEEYICDDVADFVLSEIINELKEFRVYANEMCDRYSVLQSRAQSSADDYIYSSKADAYEDIIDELDKAIKSKTED